MLPRNFFVLLVTVALLSSCSKDATAPQYNFTVPPTCVVASLKYSRDIKPIISKNCAYSGCHYPGDNNYDFTQYAVVADRIRSGRFTERIYLPVSHPLHMPTAAVMDSCEFAKLMTWVSDGFPEN